MSEIFLNLHFKVANGNTEFAASDSMHGGGAEASKLGAGELLALCSPLSFCTLPFLLGPSLAHRTSISILGYHRLQAQLGSSAASAPRSLSCARRAISVSISAADQLGNRFI